MSQPIIIIQGGAWGSESKGLVAAQLAVERDVDYAVRTGSINAGHSVVYKGKVYKMQTIPCAWVNPGTELVIGAGAYIHPETLDREVALIAEAMGVEESVVLGRLHIDKRAGLHTDEHHQTERDSGIHERMGSTGEGVAEAIKDKMDRRTEENLFSMSQYVGRYAECITDTVKMLNDAYDNGQLIMLEGTQGTMLDLHLGSYPFVTSRQVSACAWATEAGLSPSLEYEVVLVCRAMPIRVAGNSGPLPKEVEWVPAIRSMNFVRSTYGMAPLVAEQALSDLEGSLKQRAKEMNLPTHETSTLTPEQRRNQSSQLSNLYQKALESLTSDTVKELKKVVEMTTVTKKVRRIAKLDPDQLRYAVAVNRPAYIVMNFVNYLFPTMWGVKTVDEMRASPEFDRMMEWVESVSSEVGAPIKYVNFSPDCIIEVPTE